MNVAQVKEFDVANGPGVRVSLFVSGCRLHCKGCFNKEAQDFSYGEPFSDAVVEHILSASTRPFITGLSVLGGEPFEPENQEGVAKVIRAFREKFGNSKTIWVWTGYNLNRIKRTEHTDYILENIDTLVDGPFIESKKNLNLPYAGSDNQRVLNREEIAVETSRV